MISNVVLKMKIKIDWPNNKIFKITRVLCFYYHLMCNFFHLIFEYICEQIADVNSLYTTTCQT